jgi:hypothetical protein
MRKAYQLKKDDVLSINWCSFYAGGAKAVWEGIAKRKGFKLDTVELAPELGPRYITAEEDRE